MKTFFSISLAVAVSISSVRAGFVHRAANVTKNTAETTKNVGHSVVKVRLASLADIVSQPVHPTIERLTRVLEKPEQ